MNEDYLMGATVGLAFGMLITFVVFIATQPNYQDEAVKHHAAEYFLDANHNRQWRWLDEKKGEKE